MRFSLAYLVMQMPTPSEAFMNVEVRNLAQSGVEVTVFCLRERNPRYHELVHKEGLSHIRIYDFPYFFSWQIWQDVLYWSKQKPLIFFQLLWVIASLCWTRPNICLKSLIFVPKSFSIMREIQRSKIQAVHAGWGHYPAITIYLIQQFMPQIPVTVALTAYDRLMQHPMTKHIMDEVGCFITQSPTSAKEVQETWPQAKVPVYVIMLGIDIVFMETLPRVEKIPGLITSAGRLVEEKGHQYVIKAFAEIHKIYPQTKLVILGEGKYRAKLERLIVDLNLSDCVELTGHLAQADLFKRLSQSSISVLASTAVYDNLPNTIKEAMALGIPVITTSTLDIDVVVEDGVTGLLVPKGNVLALESAMRQLLGNENLAQRIGQNARQRILERADIRQTTQQRNEIYKKLLGI